MKMRGVSSVIAVILMLMIVIALAGVAFLYISGVFTQRTGVVLEVDWAATRCASGTNVITVFIRNTGTIPTTADKITLSGTTSQGGTMGPVFCGGAVTIPAGAGLVSCTNTLTGTTGVNIVYASIPPNIAKGTVVCIG